VLLEDNAWPAGQWLQQIAAGMNLHGAAFTRRLAGTTAADWALRWFTPVLEDDLCGHATLAAAHAISSCTGKPGIIIRFLTRSGILTARAGPDGEITLDFPAAPVIEQQAPDGLAKALGVPPDATFGTGAWRDLLAVFPHEATVRTMRPDLATVAALTRRCSYAQSPSPRALTPRPQLRLRLPVLLPPTGSPKTQSPAAHIPPWPRTGQPGPAAAG
jgi:predicted PhzF superfamily epimerase YddE/YHI9